MHRIVWDRAAKKTYVVAGSGGVDATLRAEAGETLAAIMRDDELSHRQKEFADRAASLGWLSSGWQKRFTATAENVPALRRLQLELTLRCNLRCGYCYSGSGPTRREALTIGSATQLIGEAIALGLLRLDLTGGELFLLPWWRELYTHAKDAGLAVTLHTNGTLLDRNAIKFLQTKPPRWLQVSLDGHVAETHDNVRGRTGAFSRTVTGIHAARDAGLPIRVALMVSRANLDTAADTVRWITTHLRVPVSVDRVVPFGGAIGTETVSHAEFYEAIAPVVRRGVSTSRVCDVVPAADTAPKCGVGDDYVYVTAQGEIALCPTMTSRDSREFSSPTWPDTSLRSAWTGSYFSRYRGVNCENVGHCSSGASCGGGCRSNAYAESGSIASPDYVACNLQKNPSEVFVDFAPLYRQGVFSLKQT